MVGPGVGTTVTRSLCVTSCWTIVRVGPGFCCWMIGWRSITFASKARAMTRRALASRPASTKRRHVFFAAWSAAFAFPRASRPRRGTRPSCPETPRARPGTPSRSRSARRSRGSSLTPPPRNRNEGCSNASRDRRCVVSSRSSRRRRSRTPAREMSRRRRRSSCRLVGSTSRRR